MIGLNSGYKSNWRGGSSQIPKAGIENRRRLGSIESDPIDFAAVIDTVLATKRECGADWVLLIAIYRVYEVGLIALL